ncbi:MAG: hypothetical protein ACLU37_12590, partial [Collinsella sp.]
PGHEKWEAVRIYAEDEVLAGIQDVQRSWATQTRLLDSSMEMNPSISLIAYSEEDARYRSHWVKSPFIKGITALRSATLKALRLCSIFSASCLNCSLSKMPPNAGFSTNQKSKRDRD